MTPPWRSSSERRWVMRLVTTGTSIVTRATGRPVTLTLIAITTATGGATPGLTPELTGRHTNPGAGLTMMGIETPMLMRPVIELILADRIDTAGVTTGMAIGIAEAAMMMAATGGSAEDNGRPCAGGNQPRLPWRGAPWRGTAFWNRQAASAAVDPGSGRQRSTKALIRS